MKQNYLNSNNVIYETGEGETFGLFDFTQNTKTKIIFLFNPLTHSFIQSFMKTAFSLF